MKVVTWNTQWATPASRRTPEVLRRIAQHAPDVVCLTEANERLLSQAGHTVSAQPDYGYPFKQGRRKVLLWSREPWAQVDDVGLPSLPPGRFVSGVTHTPLGEVTVLGICIPWFGCRTEAYRASERKARWQDHEAFLDGLVELLARMPAKRLIVMGDFNQIVGQGSRAPRNLQAKLQQAFPPSMAFATADLEFQGRKSIDHMVLSEDLAVESLDAISNIEGEGRLSDHFGVAASVSGGQP